MFPEGDGSGAGSGQASGDARTQAQRARDGRIAGHEAFQAALNGEPLEVSLGILIRTAIAETEGEVRCAFYIANADGTELSHVTGMPGSYARCIDGFKIGADALACGLAVYTGQPVITPDVTKEPLWQDWLWLAKEFDYRAVWSFPIETSAGKVVGTFAMYYQAPREAAAEDYELAAAITRAAAIIISRHEVAEERARAEAELRENEERYRVVFESIDEGFCVIEVMFDAAGRASDYRFLQINQAFERQTGLANAVGRTIREMAPEHEEFWFEVYGRIALDGKPARFEHRAEALGRWYDVYAFRIGRPEQRRVAILFRDVIERKRVEEALRESEERQTFLLALSDAMRAEHDAGTVASVALRLLRDHLKLDRTYIANIHGNDRRVDIVAEQGRADLAPMPDHLQPTDFPEGFKKAAEGVLVVGNIWDHQELTVLDRQSLGAIALTAFVVTPLHRGDEGMIWALVVGSAEPRHWTPFEVALLAEAAERIWAALERARAADHRLPGSAAHQTGPAGRRALRHGAPAAQLDGRRGRARSRSRRAHLGGGGAGPRRDGVARK